jgi:hypothetical protein
MACDTTTHITDDAYQLSIQAASSFKNGPVVVDIQPLHLHKEVMHVDDGTCPNDQTTAYDASKNVPAQQLQAYHVPSRWKQTALETPSSILWARQLGKD